MAAILKQRESVQSLWLCQSRNLQDLRRQRYLGAVSLKLLGGKLAPKLVYFVLRKELLNLSEMAPWSHGRSPKYFSVWINNTTLSVFWVLFFKFFFLLSSFFFVLFWANARSMNNFLGPLAQYLTQKQWKAEQKQCSSIATVFTLCCCIYLFIGGFIHLAFPIVSIEAATISSNCPNHKRSICAKVPNIPHISCPELRRLLYSIINCIKLRMVMFTTKLQGATSPQQTAFCWSNEPVLLRVPGKWCKDMHGDQMALLIEHLSTKFSH